MHTFKDKNEKEWMLEMNLGTALAIEQSDFTAVYDKPVKLLDRGLVDFEFFASLQTNMGLVFSVARCMAGKALQAEGLSEEEFADLIDNEAMQSMKEAVWSEIIAFFPEYATALSQLDQMSKEAMRKMGEELESIREAKLLSSDGSESPKDQEHETISMKVAGPGPTSG